MRTEMLMGAMLAGLVMASAFAAGLSRTDEPKESKPPVAPTEKAKALPPLDQKRFGFLAGKWVGKMGDDHVEEHWSDPVGNGQMGMFRWCDADRQQQANMLELLSILREEDGISLRLRHFSPVIEAWPSEKTAWRFMYNAEKSGESKAVFENTNDTGGPVSLCSYEVEGGKTLTITVKFKPTPNGTRDDLRFVLQRADAGKP